MLWKKWLLVLVTCVGLLVQGATVLAQEQHVKLPITKVILYKHGVGYFERVGNVTDEARIGLRFKAKHMSDLLKSLTVVDRGGGAIRTIAYDSTKTVDQQLGEYTFNLRTARSLPAILEQMKGSRIALKIADRELQGRLLAVERRLERVNNAQVERYRLSFITGDGTVKNYDMDEVSEIRFLDPRLQEEFQKYLGILVSRHRRDEKEVVILAGGKGRREIFVSYVQEQPIWKVSYRVVIEPKEKPLLQAWAIVDNVSDEDWENVSLSLVSGLPVSFVQNLYDPIYVKRRQIAFHRGASVGPVVYEGAEAEMADTAVARKRSEPRRLMEKGKALRRSVAGRAVAGEALGMPAAPTPSMLANMARQATAATAKATGALFVYDIKEPVTVRRDRSALLPIVNTRVEAKRVAIYNEGTRADNPMDAIHLENTTGLTLEGGPITVIEDNNYSGEALVETIKPDEKRYISFAVDLGTRANTKFGSSSEDVHMVKIIRGTMITYFKQRQTKSYNLNNLEKREKTVIIEHPFRKDWKLVSTAKPAETTKSYYRFEVALPAKAKKAFKVAEERPHQSSYAITNISREQIGMFVQKKYIDAKTEAFLRKVVALQAEIRGLGKRVQEAERQKQEIFKNQSRIRSNMSGLRQTEAARKLYARYVKKLQNEEDRLEAIEKQINDLQKQIQDKQRTLSQLVTQYSFETRL